MTVYEIEKKNQHYTIVNILPQETENGNIVKIETEKNNYTKMQSGEKVKRKKRLGDPQYN